MHRIIIITITFFSLTACNSKPRVIEASNKVETTEEYSEMNLPIFKELSKGSHTNTKSKVQDHNHQHNHASGTHEVIVEEALQAERYSYIRVKEKEESFWIAISKQKIQVGQKYRYKGGLMKRNFFSREFNRVFETIYLVSNIAPMTTNQLASAGASIPSPQSLPNLKVKDKIEPMNGAISLVELLKNKDKYSNQLVKVTGKCVKVNPRIMNRNWLHLQDGSGTGLDLTVTTMEEIPLGAIVSLEGTIALDKDFGAGYRYDIIMESASLK